MDYGSEDTLVSDVPRAKISDEQTRGDEDVNDAEEDTEECR